MARRLAAVLTTAALALATAACGGGSSPSGGSSPGASSTAPATYQKQHAGGTLHLVAQAAGGTLDPQVNYTLQYWQLYQATYDGLLAFTKVGGDQSFQVVPDLAAAQPKVTDGGKTYTFTLRKGIKFSNGQPVTTKDVVASFERIFKVSSPTAGTFYNGIVGADACMKTPATCTLPKGVVAGPGNTVAIHLTEPDPEFPYKLAVPHASILPADAPAKDGGTTPIPGTGAYYFASYNPNRSLVMKRNPHFEAWNADAQPQGYPDEIDETFGLTVEAEVTAIENGQADWMLDSPPADRLSEIGTKYADQAHVNTLTALWYATMNTNMAPFNNLKARQAVNWAIDRSATVKIFGGTNLAAPVCTFLPPGFPGHTDFCDYTKGGGTTWKAADLEKAKQLVKESGTAGQTVGIVVSSDDVNKQMGEYLQSVLNSIGYKAVLKPLSGNIQFTYIQNTKNKVQMAVSQWYQDYPAASDFLHVLLSCASFHPGSDSSINISGFCDQKIEAQMNAALKTEQTSMDEADKQWGEIDKAVMAQAPVAPLFTPKLIDFVSKRVGNYQFSKQFYMLVDQLWVK
ncbi:ABC transporter substrate-binding protein [Nocardioides sp. KR10-350]|uniref:ABC transporter substrate-binding protein n=1 Tax=Nocardioides cheoyonin TaxID=3156615 RepID=UPI0032B36290